MKMNMKQWIADTINAPVKKAMPVLSFPAIQLMDITVKDLISSSDLQARGMPVSYTHLDVYKRQLIQNTLLDFQNQLTAFFCPRE